MKNYKEFKKIVWNYYKKHGRHKQPWRTSPTPYNVLISEVMLQQKQIERVTPKFNAWIQKWPNWKSLSQAKLVDVHKEWKGLGYNNRAKRLSEVSKIVMREYQGELPPSKEMIVSLPGIGPYTTGAILAFAFNIPTIFIDTNIRRVYIHYFFKDKTGIRDSELLPHIESTLDFKNPREWYWALFDYGTYLKNTLQANPNKKSRHYTTQSPLAGSVREVRSWILHFLTENNGRVSHIKIQNTLPVEMRARLEKALKGLERDSIITQSKNIVELT